MTETLERKLTERIGKENPFRVPEGYFDTLPDKVNARIAWKRRERRLWRLAVAAVMTGCIATAGLAFMHQEEEHKAAMYAEEETIEMLIDYNMVSNTDIVGYITEAE